MELKVQNILEAEDVLEKIAFDNNIRGKYTLKLLKNFENLKKEVDRFNILRETILKKYCDKDSDNNPITENNHYIFNNPENKEKMIKDMNELLSSSINVDIELINDSAFSNINISIAQLSQIYFMIKQEEE